MLHTQVTVTDAWQVLRISRYRRGSLLKIHPGLPNSQADVDASRFAVVSCLISSTLSYRDCIFRLAVAFYCIGSLDLLGLLEVKTTPTDRESWREWIWEQHTSPFLRLYPLKPSTNTLLQQGGDMVQVLGQALT